MRKFKITTLLVISFLGSLVFFQNCSNNNSKAEQSSTSIPGPNSPTSVCLGPQPQETEQRVCSNGSMSAVQKYKVSCVNESWTVENDGGIDYSNCDGGCNSNSSIYIPADGTYQLNCNDVKIYGGTGVESLILGKSATHISSDANIESITFPDGFSNYRFSNVQGGNGFRINTINEVLVIAVPSLNQATNLKFSDKSVVVRQVAGGIFHLADAGGGIFYRADASVQVYLSSDASFILSSFYNSRNVSVYGSTGLNDHLVLTGTGVDIKADANIENITFPGVFSNYKFSSVQGGLGFHIYHFDGSWVKFSSLNQTVNLKFSDKSVTVTQIAGGLFQVIDGSLITNY